MNKTTDGAGKRRPRRRRRARGGRRGIRIEASAGFILFRLVDGRRLYLLLDYGKHWDYPKGHVEKDETPWQAAVRELFEETGISQVQRIGDFEHKIQYEFFSSRKGRVRKTVTYFAGLTEQEKVRISDEHVGYAWLDYQDAIKQLTFDSAKDVLQRCEDAVKTF